MPETAEKKELWENRNKNDVWISRYDAFGNPKALRVPPGGKVHLTSTERRYNSDRAYSDQADFFKNGTLSAVTLIDTAEDYEELSSNPNVRSESELLALFDLDARGLKKELAEIESPVILTRLRDYASSDDAENITVAKKNAVEERYSEVVPKLTGQRFEDMEDDIKPTKLRR